MAIPSAQHSCWLRLAGGELSKVRTQHLGTQLLAKRIERSSDPLPLRAAEIHAFFTKWERILPTEIAQLTTV